MLRHLNMFVLVYINESKCLHFNAHFDYPQIKLNVEYLVHSLVDAG